ncbi:MAG: ribosome maturation factor RimP [Pseudomonadales bacterium]|nr:ribosome maturation factor RimP [Pseudomonadales bacterium]
MATLSKAERLAELVRPAVTACHVELWGVDFFQQGRRSVLRVYIDAEAGVTVDQCAQVSHQVSGILDVEDPIAGEYVLEVSSPGWDRPLYNLDQCSRYIGSMVNLRLTLPLAGRRRFKGTLLRVNADGVLVLRVDDQDVEVPFAHVDKANLVAE